jgi:hypothetical protein
MGLRFVMFKGATRPHDNRSLFGLERTHASTFRTRLLFAQLAGLLLSRHFQGPCQQSTHGRHRDVFHLGKIDVQPGPLLAPLLPHDDFPPAFRQALDVLEIFGRQLVCSHVASLQ